jgi:hypothetical protein
MRRVRLLGCCRTRTTGGADHILVPAQ